MWRWVVVSLVLAGACSKPDPICKYIREDLDPHTAEVSVAMRTLHDSVHREFNGPDPDFATTLRDAATQLEGVSKALGALKLEGDVATFNTEMVTAQIGYVAAVRGVADAIEKGDLAAWEAGNVKMTAAQVQLGAAGQKLIDRSKSCSK